MPSRKPPSGCDFNYRLACLMRESNPEGIASDAASSAPGEAVGVLAVALQAALGHPRGSR